MTLDFRCYHMIMEHHATRQKRRFKELVWGKDKVPWVVARVMLMFPTWTRQTLVHYLVYIG